MKKLITLLAILTLGVASAQWSYSSEVDPFDGPEKTIYAKGYGGSFPYNNPYIIFRERKNGLEVYVTGAGSLACEEGRISFSYGDPSKVYGFNLSESVSGDAGFFVWNWNNLSKLVDDLKKNSIVYVEFKTRCSFKRFKLSLKGSTVQLNKIFNGKYKAIAKKEAEYKRKAKEDKERKEREYKSLNRVDHIMSIIDTIASPVDSKRIRKELESQNKSDYFNKPYDVTIEDDPYREGFYRADVWVIDREGRTEKDILPYRFKK